MRIFVTVILALIVTGSVLNAQPVIAPSIKGKEVRGSYVLRLKPRTGDVYHYKITSKTVVSTKNDDDLLSMVESAQVGDDRVSL